MPCSESCLRHFGASCSTYWQLFVSRGMQRYILAPVLPSRRSCRLYFSHRRCMCDGIQWCTSQPCNAAAGTMQQDVRIASIAFVSRLAFLGAAVVSDALLDDYDSSALLNSRPCDVSDAAEQAGISVSFADVWDTVFYDRISRCGYEYEHYFAFFPGLPGVMGLFGGSAGRRVLVALLTSLITFTISMVLFYRVGTKVLQDKHTATMAVLLMCISPASVFMTMAYTESLFQMLTFAGVWLLVSCEQPLLAGASFALSCAVRSNGAINAGFLAYYIMQLADAAIAGRKLLLPVVWGCVQAFAGIVCMAAVIMRVLQRGYEQFCESDAWANASTPRPYCAPGGPSLYSFIQANYWGVGLFKYYQLKQIPNFALAAPTLLQACAAIHCYVKQDPARALFLGNLGPAKFRDRVASRISGEKRASATHDTHPTYAVDATSAMSVTHTHDSADSGSFAGTSSRQSEAATGFLADGSFVFVAQLAAMALFAALFMHIQVTTRFLTTCMALYWYMAHLVLGSGGTGRSAVAGKLVLVYCTVFAWVGVVLFPNFYPWT